MLLSIVAVARDRPSGPRRDGPIADEEFAIDLALFAAAVWGEAGLELLAVSLNQKRGGVAFAAPLGMFRAVMPYIQRSGLCAMAMARSARVAEPLFSAATHSWYSAFGAMVPTAFV